MNEKKYKVYLFTFPNNKKYCGYTSQSLKHRWDNGNGYKRCPLVWRAIQKYGWDNIKKELYFSSNDKNEALNKEKEVIYELDLTNPKFGYNLHEGGQPTPPTRNLTPEARQHLSELCKQRWADPKFRAERIAYGKAHPPSKLCIERGKIASAIAHKGVTPTNAMPVYQIDKDTDKIIAEYKSACAASRAVIGENDGATNILKVCKGQRKTAYGYKWRFQDA